MFVFALLIAAVAATQLLYQFPVPPAGPPVTLENVAYRTSNGQLLLNAATPGPQMYQLNPAYPNPELLITLPAPVQALLGIAETHPGSDVFIVAAGNFSFGDNVPGGIAGVPGSFSVWSIDLSSGQAVANQVAAIPEANTLNGLTIIPGTSTVLVADSGLGAVWSVNIKSGKYEVAIQDPAFLPNQFFSLGINGVHVKNDVLYWTNSAAATYGQVPIAAKYGKVVAAGAVQTIATNPPGLAFDDFALDRKTNAYIATRPNAITKISPDGTSVVVAGGGNDTNLVNPTSTTFGGDGCTLYIVTSGQFQPPPVVAGQVFALNTCGGSWKKLRV